ncbi:MULTISPECIES: hypothetical protein [Pseudomonas]|uniref:hypothetical protein n=1 Tax=Pseudomonas TaxID=286 RepID=UPI002DB98372|nr:hypothetical protein [Pseudomonas asiatica]MEB6589358.1 hypothetical protein [Pseudomonas asiatica]
MIGELSAEGELRHGGSLPEPVSAFRWDAKGRAVYALAPEAGDILLLPGSSSVRRLASLPRGGGSLGVCRRSIAFASIQIVKVDALLLACMRNICSQFHHQH